MSDDRYLNIIDLLACPNCSGDLSVRKDKFFCPNCNSDFHFNDGFPSLVSDTIDDTSDAMKDFYEENPFPNYDEMDTLSSLINKSRKSVFANKLNEELPFMSKVLEIGCGTGQMTNYLSIANRTVVGADISHTSLKLGKNFAERHSLDNAYFVQMNLMQPPFKEESFDVIISNGVLHHTENPYEAFQKLTKFLKKGGVIIIGLYHQYSRIFHDFRKIFIRINPIKFAFLDRYLQDKNLTQAKTQAWINDQYFNPKESKHKIMEIKDWFKNNNIECIRCLPSLHLFEKFDKDEKLISKHEPPSYFESSLSEMFMAFGNHKEGGFFTVIGRKI